MDYRSPLIPAKAGIQCYALWVPAFAWTSGINPLNRSALYAAVAFAAGAEDTRFNQA